MNIRITGGERDLSISLPTRLLFNGITARSAGKGLTLVGKGGRTGVNFDAVSEAALAAVFMELNRIKRKYGSWELVEVISAGGERVRITL